MICCKRATREGRLRDRKRKRVVLQIGGMKWHLTQDEARSLGKQVRRVLRNA